MITRLIGQTIDRYQVTARLGAGRLGTVFKAHDPMLQRDVAIKVIDVSALGQSEAGEQLQQRARAAARLDHPGLVKVHDFGRANGWLYVVMDYLPGGNLRQLLQDLRANNQWLPLSEAVGVIRQVCAVLDYLARQGVPARGIKPSDLMLKPDQAEGLPYRPVLTSLGLLGESEGEWLRGAERVETSAYAYWSPEQAMGEPVDARSQVYSLGVLLYELCVGWQPFPVKTISEAARAHTRSAPLAPRARRADLPAPVEGVILRALEKDPAARYPDPAALAQALDGAQAPAELTDAAAQAAPGAWLVSLLVAYQRSLAPARAEAPAARAEPEATRARVPGRVKVVGPASAVRWEPLKAHGLTIGRDPTNDLVLDEPAIAPQHARVEFDDPHYKVVDLDSQSGSYLGGLKLMPGMPEIWEPKAPLRIGDHWLYLELGTTAAGMPARPSVYHFDGAVVDANLVQFSPNGWVGVYVEIPQLTLTPGQKSSAGVVVVNQGPDTEHFSLALGGVPQSWIAPPAPPTSLQLPPGEYQRLRIMLEPPRAPQSRAGRDAVVVRVASQSLPDQVVEAKIAVTVPAYNQFRSELSTPGAGSNEPMRVTIHNQGNTPEAYRVAFEDPEGSLVFDPPGFSLPVPAGHIGTADFYAGPRNTRLIGGRRAHRFTVRVADSTGQAQTHAAEVYSSGLVPPWAPILLLILGCLLASAAGLVVSDWRRRASAASTAIARQTADALAAADSDNDGLANLDEARLGTDALNPDTDGDGLNDGEETIWGSNPLVADSDGDTLPDGQEVNALGTSPINPDTDGDGANDNVDPDPGHLPTPTASATHTLPPPTETATAPPPTPTGTAPPATETLTPAPTASASAAAEAATATQAPPTPPPIVSPTAAATPLGGVILFESERDGRTNIYLMVADGSSQARLSNSTPDTAAHSAPTWSAAAQQIAFQSNRDGNDEIYVMNLDGSGPARLTDNSAADIDPAWSPDGTRIAFVSQRDGNPEVYVMLADGSNVMRLTEAAGADTDPTWSPDGTRIAFVSERDGNPEIYVMGANGASPTRRTSADGADLDPVWAPNGMWLAFVRGEAASAELYLMSSDGAGELRLTSNTAADTQPAWAPNSMQLAFVSERDGNAEIYLSLADGTVQTRLTHNSAADTRPVWAPNGARLTFTSERDGNPEVYVMTADGDDQARLTNAAGRDTPVAWLP